MTANIVTAFQAGNWSDTTLWYVLIEGVGQRPYNQLPTAEDDVRISSRIVIDTDAVCHDLRIKAGGELVSKGNTDEASLTVNGAIAMDASAGYAGGELRLDGVRISARPCIGAEGTGTIMLTDEGDGTVIIDDTGIYNASATLQDIKPEGCGHPYARKASNSVRYLSLTVRIQRGISQDTDHPHSSEMMVASIYRLAEGPSQVLAYNGSCIIKGYIESVVYDKNSVGQSHHVLQVTIAEGQQ